MKEMMKKIVAVLCVAVMIFNVAYVPKIVAEAATASETDTYKLVGVKHIANNVDGVIQNETGMVNRRMTAIASEKIVALDGVYFDAMFNFSEGGVFCYGGHTNSAYRLDIRPVITGGVEYLQYQLTGSTTADVGYKKIPTSDMGLKKGMIGQDVRITIGVKLSNINEETGKTNADIVFKIGPTYTDVLSVSDYALTPFKDASGIITCTNGPVTLKAVKADTDYRVVSVQDFMGLKESTVTEANTYGAKGVATFNGILVDGIYNFEAVGPHFNIGSGVNGLQINPVKYNDGGYYMRYQLLDGSKTNRSVYGQDISTTVLGTEVINTDIRIRVGFSYANVTTTDGVTTADVTVHIKIGESYEDIFTAYGYQITGNLIIRDVETEEGMLADRDYVLVAFNNVAAGAITVKAGLSADIVEVTPSDFDIADIDGYVQYGDTHKNLIDIAKNERVSIDGKALSADVQFTGTATGETFISFAGANWFGVRFAKHDANTFSFKSTIKAFTEGAVTYIDAQKAGLASASDAFNLKISVEFVDVDYDNDNAKDDIKYGIYINDRLCAERYSVGASTSAIGQMYVHCYTSDPTTSIKVSSPEPQVSDIRTPYIMEDFGVEEQVYDEGYYYQAVESTSNDVSSVTGTVALSGDAALTLYGQTSSAGYRVIDSYAIRNVGADGIYNQAGTERLNYNGAAPAIASMNGVMFDGVFNFASGSYFTIGGNLNTVNNRFQMQLNNSGLVCQLVVPSGTAMTPCTIPTSIVKAGQDVRLKIGFTYEVNAEKKADVTVKIIVNDSYEYTVSSVNQSVANLEDASGVVVCMGNSVVIKPASASTTEYTDKGLKFSMTSSGLVFSSNIAGLQLPISIPFANVTDSEVFTFTVQEEILDLDADGAKDDVRLSVWVNGEMAGNRRYYITNVAGTLGPAVYITSGTTATSGVTVQPSVKADAYNLDDTENGYLVSGQGVLTVNNDSKVNGDVIDKVGDYTVRCAKKGAYVKSVVLYKTGNAHLDEETDVIDVLDLIALKKVQNGQKTTTKSAQKGADVDNNCVINKADSEILRDFLVGNEEALSQKVNFVAHEKSVMPIVGFFGPYRSEDTRKNVSYDFITDDIYKLIKEVGINQISYTSNADYRFQPRATIDSLKLAEKYGIGLYVNDTRFSGTLSTTSYANYLKDYIKYKSFKGFFLVDEPSTSDLLDKYQIGRDMSVYADKMNLVNSFSNTMGYMNMYPKSVVGKVIGPNHIVGVDEDGVYANETSYKANRLTNIANDKITSLNNVVFDGVFNFSSNGAFGIGGHCNGTANRLQMSVVTEKGVTYFRYQLVGASGTTVNLTADDLGCQFVDKDLRITIRFILANVVDDTADVTVKIKIGPNYENSITAKNYNIDGTFVNSGGVIVGPMGKVSVKALDKDAVYRNYINTCVAPGMKYLSWDYYTFDGAAKKSEYFEHLSIMRDESATRGLPFWGFVQAGSRWNDGALDLPEANTDFPSASEVLWNANTTLAYGAKGIQYFPLVQPFHFAYEDSEDGYDYNRNGLIAANGEKTRWYDYAKAANEQIALVDEYLLYAESLDVLAIGSTAQSETGIKKTTYGSLLTGLTASRGAVVGVFNYQGKTAFYVVNYDTSESNTGADTITLNFGTNQEWEVHSTQLAADVSVTSGTSCALSLNNGGAALVILK